MLHLARYAIVFFLFGSAACGTMTVPSPTKVTGNSNATVMSTTAGNGQHTLTVSGMGFGAYEGRNLHAVLLQDGKQEVNATTTVFEGAFTVRWWNVLSAGRSYAVTYFVDVAGNGNCEPPPSDPVWRVTLPSIVGDTNVALTSNSNYVNACADFSAPAMSGGPYSITLTGSGFDDFGGLNVAATLIDNTTMKSVAMQKTVVADNGFTSTFANAAQAGKTYTIDYYIDTNENGFCNAPPVDQSWSITVPAINGNTIVAVQANPNYVGVCNLFGTFNLSVNGAQFQQQNGNNVFVVLLDGKDMSPVVGPLNAGAVAGGAFHTRLSAPLVGGHSYIVDYYVDGLGLNVCEPTAADPAGTGTIPPVSADAILDVSNSGSLPGVCAEFNELQESSSTHYPTLP